MVFVSLALDVVQLYRIFGGGLCFNLRGLLGFALASSFQVFNQS
jgi:hypothetical protein